MPYLHKSYKIRQVNRVLHSKEGIVIPMDPYAWLCDGPVKKIEEGLPLIAGTPYAHSYEEAIHADKKIKALQMECLKTFFNQDELKDDAPVERQVPVETRDERQMRMLMDKIIAKERKKMEHPRTGIIPGQPARDMIDSMGKVHIQSVHAISKKPPNASVFSRPSHPKPRVGVRPKSTVSLVRNQLQRVFRPGSEPFTNIDSDEDFPMDEILVNPDTKITEEEDTGEEEDVIDYNKINYPTMLLDESDKEIFWTKHKAPFTKDEVDMLYSWWKQDEDNMNESTKKGERMLKRREMAIKRTFQSKLAFQKELKLVNRACRDVACIGPGKSMKSKESTWTEAARAAKHDISSLPYRKERWAAFVKFVKESGGIRMELHKKFAEQYRKMLLTGRPANARMLFDVLDTFEEMNFTVIPLLVYVEFVRGNLNISKNEVAEYFSHRNVPGYFYDLAVKQRSEGSPLKLRQMSTAGKGPLASSVSKAMRASSRIVIADVQIKCGGDLFNDPLPE